MSYITRAYQYAGASYLAERSAILGYRVGLGKTWTALLALEQVGTQKNLLICPKTLKYWWVKEMENFFGGVRVEALEYNIIKVTTPRGAEIIITHYEQYINRSKVFKRLLSTKWDVVVCDEVHRIKNRAAQRTKNIKQLKSKYRWGLTGTPIADKPDDLWSLLNWVAPKVWSSYWTFVNTFCDMKYNPFSGTKQPQGLKQVGGTADATLQVLYRMTSPFLLVKTLQDVGLELPPVVHTTVWLEMADTQRKFYTQVQTDTVISLMAELERSNLPTNFALDLSDESQNLIIKSAGARFVRLQQVASAPTVFKEVDNVKLDWLRDYLEDGLAPAVIMTRFNHTVEKIQEVLDKAGATGFIVGTWAKLSEGHNFQHLDTLIAWDLPMYLLEWTQGLGRVDRPGQAADRVNVIRLACAGSVDEQLLKLIDGKYDVAQMIMDWLRGEFKNVTTTIQ